MSSLAFQGKGDDQRLDSKLTPEKHRDSGRCATKGGVSEATYSFSSQNSLSIAAGAELTVAHFKRRDPPAIDGVFQDKIKFEKQYRSQLQEG